MEKAEIAYDDRLSEKVICALKRVRGSNGDEIRKKIANLSDEDRECITKYYGIDAEQLESVVIEFWLKLVKPVLGPCIFFKLLNKRGIKNETK